MGQIKVAEKSKRMFYGIVFDSKAEGEAYLEIKSAELNGRVTKLELQKEFMLQEEFKDASGKEYKPIRYFVDFYFFDTMKNRYRCIDTKGFATEVFKIKRKLFNFRYKSKGLYVEDRL